jgi:hypothetical protein
MRAPAGRTVPARQIGGYGSDAMMPPTSPAAPLPIVVDHEAHLVQPAGTQGRVRSPAGERSPDE